MKLIKLQPLMCAAALAFSATAAASPILTGFSQTILAEGDDSSQRVSMAGGQKLLLNGSLYNSNSLFINYNGNLSFNGRMESYTQSAFSGAYTHNFLAPFFADVDTRRGGDAAGSHGSIGYGYTMFDGHQALAVTWSDVGYYPKKNDLKNTFQLVMVERADTGAGNFDFYYNYGSLQWDKSEASNYARAGYSMVGAAADFEFTGSGLGGKLLDSGANALVNGSNIGVTGRYGFVVRNGLVSEGVASKSGTPAADVPLPGSLGLLGIGALALGFTRRRKA